MENLSIKLDSRIAKEISKALKDFKYSTKTEFIRDAIRSKLKELEKERKIEQQWDKLFALRGWLKGKGAVQTDEEFYEWRKKFGEELFEELSQKYKTKNQ